MAKEESGTRYVPKHVGATGEVVQQHSLQALRRAYFVFREFRWIRFGNRTWDKEMDLGMIKHILVGVVTSLYNINII